MKKMTFCIKKIKYVRFYIMFMLLFIYFIL